jgi:hypothetical protein
MEVISREAAKAAGLKFFFTGKPCRNGHIAERYMTGWACVECSREYQKLPKEDRPKRPFKMGARDAAKANGLVRYNIGKPCKNGHLTGRYVSNGYCVTCTLEKAAVWEKSNWKKVSGKKRGYQEKWFASNPKYRTEYYHKNSERVLERRRATYEENSEVIKARHKIYRDNNPHKMAAYAGRRRASERRAQPGWLTREHRSEMEAVYAEARRLTESTGVTHHVDHIVPLRGKTVCGLHVPWNLQVLTAKDNIRKSNKLKCDIDRIRGRGPG